MRSLLLLGFAACLASAAGSVHAESGFKTFAPNKSPPPKIGSGAFAPLPGYEPYKPHATPTAPKSPGNTDGGEVFKPYKPYQPYKPTSIYSSSGASTATKPKSLYDH